MWINDRFELHEKIGSGGMGTVYKGWDSVQNEWVAIKQLHPEAVETEPEIIARFRREGEILRQLNHPNIVKMIETVQANGIHYLVMEYISGGDLTILLREKRLSLPRLLEIALDIADALTRAHRLNIVHRDLKPANVLMGADDIPRLTDFGVASFGGDRQETHTGGIVGTIDYIAPEVFNGEKADARSDIWAFGVMLFEMLTGQRPFGGRDIGSRISAILTDPVPDLEAMAPALPIALVDLIYRMLEKESQRRIPGIRMVGAELEAILKGTPISQVASYIPKFTIGYTEDTPTISGISVNPASTASVEMHHNLPLLVNQFIGREQELKQLHELLNPASSTRLVTITAPGGTGKTFLALQTGHNQLQLWAEGVFFIDLTPITDSQEIVAKIAEAVNFRFYQGLEPREQLLNFFRDKHMLLIIDNFEHVIAGAEIVVQLLQQASHVRALVTSRERLKVQGEHVFPLSSFDVPRQIDLTEAMTNSALQLFVYHAKRHQADFMLDENNLIPIAQICRLVEGLPLGIVLAASWVALLSPDEILQEIQNSLDFLESDERDLPNRHRSMRAVFNYSWQTLNPSEQLLFKQLSIFGGGFSREAAQAVTGVNLRSLLTLLNKSLIHRDANGRFSIHQLLRQYAYEHLQADLPTFQTVQNKHTQYFLEMLEQRKYAHQTSQHPQAIFEIETEIDNIISAWKQGIQQGLFAQLLEASLALIDFFLTKDWVAQGIAILDYSAEILKANLTTPEANWLYGWARFFSARMDPSRDGSREGLIQGLEHLRASKTPANYLCYALVYYCHIMPEPPLIEEAIHLAQKINDDWLLHEAKITWGTFYLYSENDPARAKGYFEEYLRFSQRINHGFAIAYAQSGLANIAKRQQDYSTAKALYQQSIAYWKAIGTKSLHVEDLTELAEVQFFMGHHEEAIKTMYSALTINRERGNRYQTGDILDKLGTFYYRMGDYQQARVLYEQSSAQLQYYERPVLNAYTQKQLCFVDIAEGNYMVARQRLLNALAVLDTNRHVTVKIDLLLAGALLLWKTGYQERPSEWVCFTSRIPVADKHEDDERQLLQQVEFCMSAEAITALEEKIETIELEDLLKTLVEELSNTN